MASSEVDVGADEADGAELTLRALDVGLVRLGELALVDRDPLLERGVARNSAATGCVELQATQLRDLVGDRRASRESQCAVAPWPWSTGRRAARRGRCSDRPGGAATARHERQAPRAPKRDPGRGASGAARVVVIARPDPTRRSDPPAHHEGRLGRSLDERLAASGLPALRRGSHAAGQRPRR